MQPADGQQVAYGHPWVASFTVFFKVRRAQRLTLLNVSSAVKYSMDSVQSLQEDIRRIQTLMIYT